MAGHRPAGEKIYVHLVPLKTTQSFELFDTCLVLWMTTLPG